MFDIITCIFFKVYFVIYYMNTQEVTSVIMRSFIKKNEEDVWAGAFFTRIFLRPQWEWTVHSGNGLFPVLDGVSLAGRWWPDTIQRSQDILFK